MRAIKRISITKEGFERLQQELKVLKEERPAAVKTLSEARNMGDLSENGLYTAAKARLRSIDNQIFRLDMQIKLADISVSDGTGEIKVGTEVTVTDGLKKTTFNLVGDFEASPKESKISKNSPLGKVLMGKKKGDIVIFNAPKGEVKYKILEVK